MGIGKKVGIALGGLGGLAAVLFVLAMIFAPGTVTPDERNRDPDSNLDPRLNDSGTGPWENRNVKKNVALEDLLSNSVQSGTIHVFEEKPTNSDGNVVWENERAIEPYFGTEQEKDQVSVSSATTTLQYQPGTYYVVVESSGHYMKFAEVTIPDGSSYDATLSEYNQAPESTTLELAETYSPTPSAIDVGVDSNTSSIEEWSGDYTLKPSEGSEYRAWKMVVHTGDVDPTTDSNSDGNHDEGIRKAYFELTGANMDSTKTSVVFNPNNGIDKLGSNDKATIMMDDVVVSKDSPLTVSSYITTFETSTSGASDGDEVLTDGENPLDFQLFSDTGTGTSKTDITA